MKETQQGLQLQGITQLALTEACLTKAARASNVRAVNSSPDLSRVDSTAAWRRLVAAVVIGTIGGVGMWSVPVALPAVQAEFGVARADASLPFTLTMIGFAFGGVLMGRLADRFGVLASLLCGALALGIGYVAAGFSTTLWQFALAHGLFVGVGSASFFGPLMADISHWFLRRRGIAVAVCAAGNYLAGTLWPTLLQHFIATDGWRATHIGVGLFCLATMLPLAFALRRPAPLHDDAPAPGGGAYAALGLSPTTLQVLLCIAGVACCVAMAMPQVHIVAYCGDLGYGVARGA